jgi:hypothetical protein
MVIELLGALLITLLGAFSVGIVATAVTIQDYLVSC